MNLLHARALHSTLAAAQPLASCLTAAGAAAHAARSHWPATASLACVSLMCSASALYTRRTWAASRTLIEPWTRLTHALRHLPPGATVSYTHPHHPAHGLFVQRTPTRTALILISREDLNQAAVCAVSPGVLFTQVCQVYVAHNRLPFITSHLTGSRAVFTREGEFLNVTPPAASSRSALRNTLWSLRTGFHLPAVQEVNYLSHFLADAAETTHGARHITDD